MLYCFISSHLFLSYLILCYLILSYLILSYFQAMCKIYYYVWNVSNTASIVILTTIAVERFIAIIYPLKAKYFRRRKKLVVSCIIIWTIAVVYNIPYLFYYDTVSLAALNTEFCYFNKNSAFGLKGLCLANFIVWFLLPLTLIGVLYVRVGIALWKIPVGSAMQSRSCSSNTGSQPSLQSCEDSHTLSDSSIEHEPRTKNGKCCAAHHGSHFELDMDTPKSNRASIQTFASHLARNFRISVSNKLRNSNRNRANEVRSMKVNVGRRKVIRLLIAVVVSFAVCVLPHHLKVINFFWHIVPLPHNVDVYFSPISFIVLYLNNCLNPILYALFSTNFRTAFSESMTRSCSRSNKQIQGKRLMVTSTIRR